ncbi:ATP-binding protein [Dyadobacter sp. CY107]|uniref:ATP-binding protein n=1 Tax=Dyadobacter fanqingshengii TaxID=2906443 RepID=UPI001F2F2B37|nr:ATP-binding protein [Dyadobacter fanqingshengii]MCF2503231.1 ATP-binding protein [Dyadobacter fanqingshengii]
MIHRYITQEIQEKLSRSPAVAILGPRQVGKTTLAKLIAKSNLASFTYLDAENPRDMAKLADAYTYLDSLRDSCVIIDEVQLMPELFSLLRPLIDEDRSPGRFILLGSASPALVKGVSESLAGRISYTELTPVGLSELTETQQKEHHWFRGGFPEALLANSEATAKEWLDDFIRSYVERDLAYLFGVELSPATLRNFWRMLAHSNGNVWNAEVFARSLGITAPTVLRYTSFLEGGYMIRRLQPWFVNAKKRLVKSPKVYIRDTGILHRLLFIDSTEDLYGHPGIGGSWEGYVIEQIAQRISKGLELFYYRTQAGAECDLVLVRGITPIACIEIKLTNAPMVSKGFISCTEDLEPAYKFIITPSSDTYTTAHSVTVISLFNFLETDLNKI